MMSMINEVKQRDLIGGLIFVGILQFILAVLIGEGTTNHPNYSSAIHYVSTLGSGSTTLLFSFSVALMGLFLVVCTYFVHKEYGERIPSVLLLLSGVSAIGVGVFPENVRPFHGIFTGFVFLFAALFLISAFKFGHHLTNYLISITGCVILVLLFVLFPYLGLEVESQAQFLGFYKGTLERIVIYLTLTSFLLLGGFLSR